MHLACTRFLFLFAFIACALILGTIIYLQETFGLEPCVLCLAQRAVMIVCGALCLAAAWHSPGTAGWRRYGLVLLLIAAVGAGVAGSQVWLQTATDDQLVPIVARFEHLLHALSLDAWVNRLDSEFVFCAEINWSLFGFSLPELSLLAFSALILLAGYPLFSGPGRRPVAEGRVGD
ncbi:disulfide bond formation protein B [Pseudomonas sp. R1-18]|uniref:disulfide bond formation protein B n=1 Tax=Pseudomonas sp. R1-18 TaxID=1632772 RepID=UPI003DA846C9